jgi:beta-1,4-N-acetylglucosaminyltransferase
MNKSIINNVFIYLTLSIYHSIYIKKIIDTNPFINLIKQCNCNKLIIQIGRGEYSPIVNLPNLCMDNNIEFVYYKFKPTLHEDMHSADLIISHCGAGSILEALDMKKYLIVVINDSLQGNHQSELSDALTEKNYLYSTIPNELISLLNKLIISGIGFKELSLYPPTDYDLFPSLLGY